MEEKKLAIRLSAIYIVIYGAIACIYPFLAYYFQTKGLSYLEMGIGFATVSITGVVVQPIWGFLTDKYSNKRTIVMVTMVLSSMVVYLLVFVSGFYGIIVSIIVLLSFLSPITPIVDAYSYEIMEHNTKLQYGKIRLMGSFGYAVVALFLGYIVKYSGITSCYFIYSALMLCGLWLLTGIHYQGKGTPRKMNFNAVLALINDKKFLLLMISVVLINIGNGSNTSYIPILIEHTGGDVTKLGLVWFVIAISELPAFYFGAGLLGRYGELNLYIMGTALFALRYFLDSICISYIPVLIIQLLQGVTYTFFLMTSLQYLNKITPVNMRTSGITMHAAAMGIGGVMGNIGGGMLLEHVSIFMLYELLGLTCILCVLILLLLKKMDSNTVPTCS